MMNSYLILVITSILIGVVCAVVAHRTRRDPLLWFACGVVLNLFALAAIAMISKQRSANGKRNLT